MVVPEHRRWMYNRILPGDVGYTQEFMNGVKEFDEFAKAYAPKDNQKYKCPCSMCKNKKFLSPVVVQSHLYQRGFVKGYWYWTCHGEVEPQDYGQPSMPLGSSMPKPGGKPIGAMTVSEQIKRIPFLNYLDRFPEVHAPDPKIKNKKRQEKIASDVDETLSSESCDDDDDLDESESDGENSENSGSSDVTSETPTPEWVDCKPCRTLSINELIWMTHGLYAELGMERRSNKELQERLHELEIHSACATVQIRQAVETDKALLDMIGKRENILMDRVMEQIQGFSEMTRAVQEERKTVQEFKDLVANAMEEITKRLATSSMGPSGVEGDASETLPSSSMVPSTFKGDDDASESSASDK